MKRLFLLLFVLTLSACCQLRHSKVKATSTIKVDTVWQDRQVKVLVYSRDTVFLERHAEQLPGAESMDSLIELHKALNGLSKTNAKLAKNLRDMTNRKFSTDTMFAETQYAKAWSGVHNNIPFLNLQNKPFSLAGDTLLSTPTVQIDRTNTTDTAETYIERDWKSYAFDVVLWTAILWLPLLIFGAYHAIKLFSKPI